MAHPRTEMMDLLESLRLAIKSNRGALSDTQVLVVLAAVVEDHAKIVWHQTSSKEE